MIARRIILEYNEILLNDFCRPAKSSSEHTGLDKAKICRSHLSRFSGGVVENYVTFLSFYN